MRGNFFSNSQGTCYIETANLDGETNLKIRQAIVQTAEWTESKDLSTFEGTIECDPPNRFLYDFTGTISISEMQYALNGTQVLLRGSRLKNTEWVVGCVVYTGHESKLVMNSTETRFKRYGLL